MGCFVAGGAELFDDFEDGISRPVGGNVAGVVELEREQHLVAPPSAGLAGLSLDGEGDVLLRQRRERGLGDEMFAALEDAAGESA